MCLARRPHIVQHSAYPGRYASNHSGRMTDIPLCLHKRVELGKIATHLRYHDIKMSTRCVSNYKKTIYKNIICRNCHVTPNVDSEKIKKKMPKFCKPGNSLTCFNWAPIFFNDCLFINGKLFQCFIAIYSLWFKKKWGWAYD